MAHTVAIRIDPGTPRTGLWCEHCQLPSAMEADVLHLRRDGVSVLGTYRGCTGCGRRIRNVPDPMRRPDMSRDLDGEH
jgi:hypothetical protein